jgi:hypothetical protein
MKTREEVEKLKHAWLKDPIWDISETEGFEEYKDELTAYQKKIDDNYKLKLQEEHNIEKSEADKLGVHGLYRIIKDLYIQNIRQHEAIEYLTEGQTNSAYRTLRNDPEYISDINPEININKYLDSQTNSQQQIESILNRQLEIAAKTAYVQGVCECVAVIGDDHVLGKKLLSEMKVTKDMAKKFANPETYKTLEQGIFLQEYKEEMKRQEKIDEYNERHPLNRQSVKR